MYAAPAANYLTGKTLLHVALRRLAMKCLRIREAYIYDSAVVHNLSLAGVLILLLGKLFQAFTKATIIVAMLCFHGLAEYAIKYEYLCAVISTIDDVPLSTSQMNAITLPPNHYNDSRVVSINTCNLNQSKLIIHLHPAGTLSGKFVPCR